MSVAIGPDVVAAKSVRDLVRPQLGLDEDPWELALVQRDLVWKQDRMVSLLDSLLAGYPIGSLLLCRVQQETDARQLGTTQGQERRVAAGTPQLVDGQQRAYALLSIFTGKGHGTFYVSLTKEWDRTLSYIEWRPTAGETEVEDDSVPEEPIPSDHIDLSRWADLADAICGRLSADTLDEVVIQLAPGFTMPKDPSARDAVLDRIERLCRAWQERGIPVITATVDGPEDILELFTRVNRGGTQVSGNDLYFAAVKTFWHDPTVPEDASVTAKAALAAVVSASGGFLDTWGALSLVSRLALMGLNENDMVPMKVDRLSRANKTYVIRALRATSPTAADRIAPFTDALRANSELKQGLRFVHRYLWEEVFAWVVASNREDCTWTGEDMTPVERYLIGASLISYPQVLGDTYRRDAFAVALAAGLEHEPFPMSRLLAVARNRGEDLRRGRSVVLPSTAVTEIARRNGPLIVAAAQGLDDEVGGLDWDHILPADYKGRSFRLPRGSGHRYRDEAVHFNDPGNFWQIDLVANRTLQATPPAEKFEELEGWPKDGMGRIAPSRFAGIDEDHLEQFARIGRLLDDGKIEEAAPLFATLVADRNDRLVKRLLDQPSSPPLTAFASDVAVIPESVPAMPTGLAEVLGVQQIKADLDDSKVKMRADTAKALADIELLLGLELQWAGQAGKANWVLRESTKQQAKVSGAGVGWWVQHNPESRSAWRPVPLLPLESKDHFELMLTGVGTGDGLSPFRLRVRRRDCPNFETIRERLQLASEFNVLDVDGNLEIPLSVSPELDWGQMLTSVDRQVMQFRTVVEADDLPGITAEPPTP